MAGIVFYYPAPNPFHPAAYETEGVGGSEAALILAGRALARRGHAVTVFNHIPEAKVRPRSAGRTLPGLRKCRPGRAGGTCIRGPAGCR